MRLVSSLKKTTPVFTFFLIFLIPQAQNVFASTDINLPSKIVVVFEEDALTVKAKNVTSAQVIQSIGKELGFETVFYGDLPKEVSNWSFARVPLLEAIRNIIGDTHRIVIFYDSSGPRKVSEVWVFEREIYQVDHSISHQLDTSSLLAPEPTTLENFDSENHGEPDTPRGRDQILQEKLGDVDPDVRLEVVNTLGGNSSEWVIPILGQVIFGDSNPYVRLAAVEALKHRDSEAAAIFLESASRDENEEVRRAAMNK